jgi:hypothetical protein
VQYGGGASIKAQLGRWNLLDVKLYNPKTLRNWAVVSCVASRIADNPREGPEASLSGFCRQLQQVMERVGMSVSPPCCVLYKEPHELIDRPMMQAANEVSSTPSSSEPTAPFVCGTKHTTRRGSHGAGSRCRRRSTGGAPGAGRASSSSW